jgi:hypothetical protein
MSAVFALITGTLFKPAEEKTSSKTGRTFVSAVIKVGGENVDGEFWACLVFSESVQGELLRLGVGDAVSAQGSAKIELYQKDGGEVRISRTIFANAILPLRAGPRERRAKDQTPAKETAAAGAPAFFSDDIPF